jgi:mannose/fructose/N-acetylgalactosamine-specific phosphotransferase system component IIC
LELVPGILSAAITIISLSALGAIIGLDYIAWGQTMLAQPVIAGVILGFFSGEPVIGMWAGLAFQFLWAGKLPIGQYVPPNSFNAAAFMVIVATALPDSIPAALRVVSAGLLAVPVGIVGGRGDVKIKKGNDKIVAKAEAAIDERDFGGINRAIVTGLFRFFRKDFILLLVSTVVATALLWPLLTLAEGYIASAAELAYRVLPAIGIGAALRGLRTRRNLFWYIAGLVVGVVTVIIINWDVLLGLFS